jgi:peptide/nickel transport system substrate-binding protein
VRRDRPIARRLERRVGILATAVVAIALVTAACAPVGARRASGPIEATGLVHPSTPVNYQPEAGQTFLTGQEPSNWNPHAAAGPDGDLVLDDILSPVLPSVFEVSPDFGVQLNTTFVESAVQTSAAPQTIVYQINPQAVWSDGTAITYQDFVYNWQAQSGDPSFTDTGGQPYQAASTDGYRQIASVSESGGDPYKVKVVLKSTDNDWRSLFSMMLPAHVADQVGFDTGFTDPVDDLSAGPFEIQSYAPGSSVTLVRNPRYWGAPANLAEVTFRFVTDPGQVLPTFEDGDVDAGAPAPSRGLESVLLHAVSAHPPAGGALPGFVVDDVAGPQWQHLDFNQANPVLADVDVRRAIMMAVDRTQLIASTIGQDDPSVKPLGSLIFVPGQPGYRNDAGVYGTGNVAGARTALGQAGYAYRGRVLTSGGEPVTLRITAEAGDPLLQAEEEVLVAELATIGIAVTESNSTNLLATLRSKDFDMAIVSSVASPFLSTVADRYQTNAGSGAGADNFDSYSSPTTDALIAQAEAATRPATRLRLFDKLDGQLWSDAVSLPLFQVPQLLVYDKSYLNMVDSPAPGGATWDMAKWGVAVSG